MPFRRRRKGTGATARAGYRGAERRNKWDGKRGPFLPLKISVDSVPLQSSVRNLILKQ
jgi:hypothetical protein